MFYYREYIRYGDDITNHSSGTPIKFGEAEGDRTPDPRLPEKADK
jgi:hypothetical protein